MLFCRENECICTDTIQRSHPYKIQNRLPFTRHILMGREDAEDLAAPLRHSEATICILWKEIRKSNCMSIIV